MLSFLLYGGLPMWSLLWRLILWAALWALNLTVALTIWAVWAMWMLGPYAR
jgi:hypothetical protein